MTRREKRMAELRESIPEVDVTAALALQAAGAVLLDVREPDEVAGGTAPGAIATGRGFMENRVEEAVADADATVLVMCAAGARSLFAAETLLGMGYTDVRNVAGGFNSWKQAGLPVEVPRVLDSAQRERYGRHLRMPEVGEAGQLKLLDSKVLLVGAGGLGSPAALYLAAAGVGTLGIVDDDVVDRSNLQRQVLHNDARVGTPKVDSAVATLTALNPSVTVRPYPLRLDVSNVDEVLPGYDVLLDGADNFPTRYLLNDACLKHGIPNVHGSVFRFEGQVSVFWPAREGPCYRCVYPEPPPPEMAPSCAEAGVLGVLPGVVGLLQAVEAVKLLLGVGRPLMGRLLHYDALGPRFTTLKVGRDPGCAWCGGEFPGYVNYIETCSG